MPLWIWIIVAAPLLLLVLGMVGCAFETLPSSTRELVGGIVVVVVFLYLAGGIGYAVYSSIVDPPSEFMEYDDYCPGPPYAVC